jgi:hypothetical protein
MSCKLCHAIIERKKEIATRIPVSSYTKPQGREGGVGETKKGVLEVEPPFAMSPS